MSEENLARSSDAQQAPEDRAPQIKELSSVFSKNTASDSMFDFRPRPELSVTTDPKADLSARESAPPSSSETVKETGSPDKQEKPASAVKEKSAKPSGETQTS